MFMKLGNLSELLSHVRAITIILWVLKKKKKTLSMRSHIEKIINVPPLTVCALDKMCYVVALIRQRKLKNARQFMSVYFCGMCGT